MKKVIISLFMGIGIICTVPRANAQDYKEHISKEFTVAGTATTLFIYNISGSIKVEGYSGNKILLDMDETISGDTKDDVEKGKKEFKLGFDQKSDSIVAYIAEPFDTRPHRHRHYDYDNDEVNYNFNVDFTVKVPSGTNLNISTVNDGLITVNNVNGDLHINNVNEGISVTNAKGTTYAHTVNGNVSVTYLSNPSSESLYYTINGDINVSYKPDLSADLQFKSMNGEFFTDFPDAQVLPASVTKSQEKKGGNLVYKLNSSMAVRFGKGGKIFKFETLNGNVYIKKS
jgi:DUF4097 and DUF4098 domain-containing protein YvlB